MGAWEDATGWVQENVIDPIAGVDRKAAPQRPNLNYDDYDYVVGQNPFEREMIRQGHGLTRGMRGDYGPAPKIRLAGEGNPEQLAAGRARRNAQYEAAGLPSVGFDPGRAGSKMSTEGRIPGAQGLARGLERQNLAVNGPRPAGPSALDQVKGSAASNIGDGPSIPTEFKPPTIRKDKR